MFVGFERKKVPLSPTRIHFLNLDPKSHMQSPLLFTVGSTDSHRKGEKNMGATC